MISRRQRIVIALPDECILADGCSGYEPLFNMIGNFKRGLFVTLESTFKFYLNDQKKIWK